MSEEQIIAEPVQPPSEPQEAEKEIEDEPAIDPSQVKVEEDPIKNDSVMENEDYSYSEEEEEEEFPEEETKAEKPVKDPFYKHINWKYVGIGCGVIAGIVVIALLITAYLNMKPKFAYDIPMPYIPSEKLENSIQSFINLKGRDQFLMVYGPHGVGKSRGIRVISSQLLEQGFLPFIIDFGSLSKTATPKHLRYIVQEQIIDALIKFDGKEYNLKALRDSIQALESLSLLQKHKATPIRENIKDVTIARIAVYLKNIATGIEENPGMGIRVLLQAIDSLNPGIKPVVFILDPDRLSRSECEQVAKAAPSVWAAAEDFAREARPTPLIFEQSDMAAATKRMKPGCRPIYIGESSLENIKKTLLGRVRVFAPKEISLLQSHFGGVGRFYAEIYDRAKGGCTVPDAITVVENRIADTMGVYVKPQHVKLLRGISRRGEVPLTGNEENAMPLLEAGILRLTESGTLAFHSVAYKRLFEEKIRKMSK